MRRLASAKVTIFGLGGVGSFAAEALARSGVGALKLVDFDRVCATNVNRQLQAMKGTVGRVKAELTAERCQRINPDANLTAVEAFYNASNGPSMLADSPDWVIDAIDNVTAKMHLIMSCRERGIPLVSCMGAAGKLDPTQVRLADLSETHRDPLARDLRKYLRKNWGLDTSGPTGILTVFSPEPRTGPFEPGYDAAEGFKCICPHGANGMHDCEERNQIDGTASFVTGTFGLVAASAVVRALVKGRP
jgi:tRNA A37 threonylcarbamoyladenosine dehydratase